MFPSFKYFSVTLLVLLLLFQCYVYNVIAARKSDTKKVNIDLKQEERIKVNKGENVVIYINNNQYQKKNLMTLFSQLSIEITSLMDKTNEKYSLPFHSIGGISNDDAHTHIKNIFTKAINIEKDHVMIDNYISNDDNNILYKIPFLSLLYFDFRTFLRDIFSSCPSPIFGNTNRNKCTLFFSSFSSTTKVTVNPNNKEIIQLNIKTSYDFNNRLVVRLVAGIFIVVFAHTLAKSKVFQVRYMHSVHSVYDSPRLANCHHNHLYYWLDYVLLYNIT